MEFVSRVVFQVVALFSTTPRAIWSHRAAVKCLNIFMSGLASDPDSIFSSDSTAVWWHGHSTERLWWVASYSSALKGLMSMPGEARAAPSGSLWSYSLCSIMKEPLHPVSSFFGCDAGFEMWHIFVGPGRALGFDFF